MNIFDGHPFCDYTVNHEDTTTITESSVYSDRVVQQRVPTDGWPERRAAGDACDFDVTYAPPALEAQPFNRVRIEITSDDLLARALGLELQADSGANRDRANAATRRDSPVSRALPCWEEYVPATAGPTS